MMKKRIKHIFTISTLILSLSSYAQLGMTEILVKIEEGKFSNELNKALLASMESGEAHTMSDKFFYNLQDYNYVMKKVNELKNKSLISLKAIFEWDTQKRQAILMGYAPIYKNYPNTSLFYIAGDFKKMLNDTIYNKLSKDTRNEFYRLIDKTRKADEKNNVTYRNINTSEYSCIEHLKLEYLPQLTLKAYTQGIVTLFEDSTLFQPLTVREAKEKYNITLTNYDSLEIKTIIIGEEWKDTTINYQYINPTAPEKMDFLIKKIKCIGLVLKNKKIIWINYDEYVSFLTNSGEDENSGSYNNKKITYDLYFDSSFCKLIKTSIYKK